MTERVVNNTEKVTGITGFRPMRRKKQQMGEKEAAAVLERGTYGVLGLCGDGGYPYTVPLNYVYENGVIYFHCAQTGHKLDAMAANPKVSFCVVDEDRVVPEKFTTAYRSVVIFGTGAVITDEQERYRVLSLLVSRFSLGYEKEGARAIKSWQDGTAVAAVVIEHITGKEGRELMNG